MSECDPKEIERVRRLRQAGHTCREIAARMGKTTDAVKALCKRHRITLGDKAHARTARAYDRLTPQYEPPLSADDGHYIAALIALGGFTRENQWGARR